MCSAKDCGIGNTQRIPRPLKVAKVLSMESASYLNAESNAKVIYFPKDA